MAHGRSSRIAFYLFDGVVGAGEEEALDDEVLAVVDGELGAAGGAGLAAASFSPPVFSLPFVGFSFSE